jgi:ADP-ribose pyrophosphatase YjhB (NUDIX family)
VSGVDEAGTERVRSRLPHGTDPEHLLASAGFTSIGARTVHGQADPYTLILEYAVRPASEASQPRAREPWRDPGLVVAADEQPSRRQRVAVYAWCRSVRGLLLTQFSERTNVPGKWGPPGGGLDAGELPGPALHREVFEETGQRIEVEALLGVHDGHWLGRAPSGRLEDFHALRLVYSAYCETPSDPVVHDVGGTTMAAAWVPVEQIDHQALAGIWGPLLAHYFDVAATRSVEASATGADRAARPPRPGPADPPRR